MCPSSKRKLSSRRTFNKAASASSGALLTSLFVTPLDVVKTRLQAQAPVQTVTATTTPASLCTCTHFSYSNGLMEHMVGKHMPFCGFAKKHVHTASTPTSYTGTLDALRRIPKVEGWRALWSGLPPTLLIAVPSTVFYFSIYDEMIEALRESRPDWKLSGPLLAGAAARSVAATVVSPLELVRTQMQARVFVPGTPRTSVAAAFRAIVSEEGVAGLFRGLGPTLARDVPFSAVYWLGYETIKAALVPEGEEHPSFGSAFTAGAASGALAAAVTTPFDVVKTRRQINLYTPVRADYPRNALQLMAKIVRTEGPGALLTGLVPRLAKVAPACALMISSYEVGKAMLDE